MRIDLYASIYGSSWGDRGQSAGKLSKAAMMLSCLK